MQVSWRLYGVTMAALLVTMAALLETMAALLETMAALLVTMAALLVTILVQTTGILKCEKRWDRIAENDKSDILKFHRIKIEGQMTSREDRLALV